MQNLELIINPDGSIFHLHIKPRTVGKQNNSSR